jgi:O-acetyl-ADP-ribose deacetylase (regulator of RNase III)
MKKYQTKDKSMVYMENRMDIRNAPDNSDTAVAHCIAADLNWGSGVAPIIIREMFDAEKSCRYKCSTNPDGVKSELKVGEILAVKPSGHNTTLVNLITKLRSSYKPTYEHLTESLVTLKNYMNLNGLTTVYMPKIGCGIDMLKWEVVSQIVKGVFANTNISIIIAVRD